jgi:hypothetical protein
MTTAGVCLPLSEFYCAECRDIVHIKFQNLVINSDSEQIPRSNSDFSEIETNSEIDFRFLFFILLRKKNCWSIFIIAMAYIHLPSTCAATAAGDGGRRLLVTRGVVVVMRNSWWW